MLSGINVNSQEERYNIWASIQISNYYNNRVFSRYIWLSFCL